jgi:Holliday junction DNA helicase RuvA
MIEYIEGELVEAAPGFAVIATQGIGYKLFIPLNNYSKLPQQKKTLRLYVSTVIREDAHKSYGFISQIERDYFERLIEVSGIGPKTALALIGHMELADLQLAITQSNVTLISKVPGIGKKTAERLIVELKDKTAKLQGSQSAASLGGKDLFSDALSALVNLGYQPLIAQKAVKKAIAEQGSDPDLASVITLALRSF